MLELLPDGPLSEIIKYIYYMRPILAAVSRRFNDFIKKYENMFSCGENVYKDEFRRFIDFFHRGDRSSAFYKSLISNNYSFMRLAVRHLNITTSANLPIFKFIIDNLSNGFDENIIYSFILEACVRSSSGAADIQNILDKLYTISPNYEIPNKRRRDMNLIALKKLDIDLFYYTMKLETTGGYFNGITLSEFIKYCRKSDVVDLELLKKFIDLYNRFSPFRLLSEAIDLSKLSVEIIEFLKSNNLFIASDYIIYFAISGRYDDLADIIRTETGGRRVNRYFRHKIGFLDCAYEIFEELEKRNFKNIFKFENIAVLYHYGRIRGEKFINKMNLVLDDIGEYKFKNKIYTNIISRVVQKEVDILTLKYLFNKEIIKGNNFDKLLYELLNEGYFMLVLDLFEDSEFAMYYKPIGNKYHEILFLKLLKNTLNISSEIFDNLTIFKRIMKVYSFSSIEGDIYEMVTAAKTPNIYYYMKAAGILTKDK